jgi:hypothetical protein
MVVLRVAIIFECTYEKVVGLLSVFFDLRFQPLRDCLLDRTLFGASI